MPLIGGTIAIDFAVMDKQPKGISKRLQVEDSQDTVDWPQIKSQRGDDCVFSLPSAPASDSMALDQDSTSKSTPASLHSSATPKQKPVSQPKARNLNFRAYSTLLTDHHPLPPPYSTLLAHLGTEICIATLLAYHETKTYITTRGSLAKLAMSYPRLPDHGMATHTTDYCAKCNITFKEPFQS